MEERTLLLRKGTEAWEGIEREERGKGLAPQKKIYGAPTDDITKL